MTTDCRWLETNACVTGFMMLQVHNVENKLGVHQNLAHGQPQQIVGTPADRPQPPSRQPLQLTASEPARPTEQKSLSTQAHAIDPRGARTHNRAVEARFKPASSMPPSLRFDGSSSFSRTENNLRLQHQQWNPAIQLAPNKAWHPRLGGTARFNSSCEGITNYVALATCMMSRLPRQGNQNVFLFVMMGNRAFVPFINNWLCNTAQMAGVHERTIIIFNDDGQELMSKQFPVRTVQLKDQSIQALAGNMDFSTYGYWRLVQLRVQVLLNLMRARIPLLLFEPDALWVQNPLDDPALISNADLLGFDDHQGKPGFGWLRILPSDQVIALFSDMERRFSSQLPASGLAFGTHLEIEGEQAILHDLLIHRQNTPYSDVAFYLLPQSKYMSGKWYDGGRGGDGSTERYASRLEGTPFVINNNWIIGNMPKIRRAKRWGHWFVQDEARGTCADVNFLKRSLAVMQQTMQTLRPLHGDPPWDECPKC